MELKLKELLENTGDMALKRRALNILNYLNPRVGDRVIDIGCGDGYYLHLLSNLKIKNLSLFGTDYDPRGLKKAEKNLNPNIPILEGDLMKKLPFADSSFDKAVMSEVAEHLPNDIVGLTEVARILKKNGTICLTVPHQNYPFFWDPLNWLIEHMTGSHIKSGFFAGIWNQHERLYTPEQIRQVMEKSGFVVEEVKSLTCWSLPFNHYIINLVARYLHQQYLKGQSNKSLNKFSTNFKRSPILNLAFWLVNKIDKLNDIWQIPETGVSVFVLAHKK